MCLPLTYNLQTSFKSVSEIFAFIISRSCCHTRFLVSLFNGRYLIAIDILDLIAGSNVNTQSMVRNVVELRYSSNFKDTPTMTLQNMFCRHLCSRKISASSSKTMESHLALLILQSWKNFEQKCMQNDKFAKLPRTQKKGILEKDDKEAAGDDS
jgi:hypothetical protein